jgi:hypothetical protein
MKLNAISSKSPVNRDSICHSKVLMYPGGRGRGGNKIKNKRVRCIQSNNMPNQLYYDVPPTYFGLYKAITREVVYKGTQTQQILSKMYMCFRHSEDRAS